MRTRPVRMSIDEYHRQPTRPGWKCEYWDGKARLQPRHSVAIVRCETVRRPVVVPEGFVMRPATLEDAPALVTAFYEAFRETVDYWDYIRQAVRKSALESITGCFAGRRGAFHPASFLAIAPTRRSIAGAALIVNGVDGPNVDLLFVRPRWQRLGLATALVQSAMNALHDAGEPFLDSGHLVANAQSAAWHRQFGFVELPDLTRAREEAHCARQELHRREDEGALDAAEHQRLKAQAAYWEQQVDALQAIADRDGWEAVSPILRRGRARKRTGENNHGTPNSILDTGPMETGSRLSH